MHSGVLVHTSGIVHTNERALLADDIVSPRVVAPKGSLLLLREVSQRVRVLYVHVRVCV